MTSCLARDRERRLAGVRGGRVWLAGAIALAAFGCDGPPFEWRARFSSPDDADRTRAITAKILRGGCRGEEVAYEETFRTESSAASAPPELEDGHYGFSIVALDASCRVVATGCVETDLPLPSKEEHPSLVVILTTASSTSSCERGCVDGICGGAMDAAADAPRDGNRDTDADGDTRFDAAECESNSDCRDEPQCTLDMCVEGKCTHTPNDSQCRTENPCQQGYCDATLGCLMRLVNGECPGGGACVDGRCCTAVETMCRSRRDEDCDGLIDCADPNCEALSCGFADEICDSGSCVCTREYEMDCTDDTDDDCDGTVDCADSDCDEERCGPHGVICVAGACVCPTGPVEICPGSVEMNGVDDDCDGEVDCEDSDCIAGCPTCADLGCSVGDGGTQYCEQYVQTCMGPARCVERPPSCPTTGVAVCGCDGRPYVNSCWANQAGVDVAHSGDCP